MKMFLRLSHAITNTLNFLLRNKGLELSVPLIFVCKIRTLE